MEPLTEALRLIRRQTGLENAMRRPIDTIGAQDVENIVSEAAQ